MKETRAAMAKAKNDNDPVVIKKYANRRLYNTDTSSYVTLDDLCEMVKRGEDFAVYDAKSGDEITRSVLAQIIFEQESKGENLLPIGFLRQLIGFYDDQLRGLVPSYLEVAMENFTSNQEQIRSNLEEAFGGMFPFQKMQELNQQNMAMFEQALSMFSPFNPGNPGATNGETGAPTPEPQHEVPAEKAESGEEMSVLRDQLDRMQAQLDALSGRK